MATYVFYGDTADGDVYNGGVNYATARTNATGSALNSGNSAEYAAVGQQKSGATYYLIQSCIGFSVTGVAGTILSATLDLYIHNDQSATDFTIEARGADWGATVTSADYIVGGSISGSTLRASLATSGITANAYNSFTSEAGFAASIGSSVKLMLFSDRNTAGTTPTGDEYIGFRTGDYAAARPRLTIVDDTPTPAIPTQRRRPRGLYVR